MKNILAENMLRFGVKNLSKSNIKNIEESVLTEDPTQPAQAYQPYAAINPNAWKFKDIPTGDKIFDQRTYPVKLDTTIATEGGYGGSWTFETIPNSGGRKQMRQDARIAAQFIAVSLAQIMNANGVYNPLYYKDLAKVIQASGHVSALLNNKISNNATRPDSYIGNANYVSMDTNRYGEYTSQKEWELLLNTIAPAITTAMTNAGIIKPQPTVKQAAPTTPAPVKKN